MKHVVWELIVVKGIILQNDKHHLLVVDGGTAKFLFERNNTVVEVLDLSSIPLPPNVSIVLTSRRPLHHRHRSIEEILYPIAHPSVPSKEAPRCPRGQPLRHVGRQHPKPHLRPRRPVLQCTQVERESVLCPQGANPALHDLDVRCDGQDVEGHNEGCPGRGRCQSDMGWSFGDHPEV
jgi:hypothetical protein